MVSDYDVLVILGPTASGKTSLAASVAARLEGEIISADSRQVYRGMNLGTGKDYDDYVVGGRRIPYHLIDIVDPGYKYNLFEYQRDFFKIYDNLKKRGVFPVVCGGSGMYIDSIISKYKLLEVPPDAGLRNSLEMKSMEELTGILSAYRKLHNITDIDTKKRVIRAIEIEHYNLTNPQNRSEFPDLKILVAGIMPARENRRARISERLKARLDSGMVREVKQLMENGMAADALIYYGLEYKYITLYLTGKLTYPEMVRELEIAIHQYAKRQMTWFRGMERRGIKINWLHGAMPAEEKVSRVLELLGVTKDSVK
jgi:tRNA dimethylallyltransferase